MKDAVVVSDCCGAEPRGYAGPHGTVDSNSQDFGICPVCHEHCEYVSLEDEISEVGSLTEGLEDDNGN